MKQKLLNKAKKKKLNNLMVSINSGCVRAAAILLLKIKKNS